MQNNQWETIEFRLIPKNNNKKLTEYRWKVTYIPNKEAFLTLQWTDNCYGHYSVQSKTWSSTHNFPQEVIVVTERIVTGKNNKLPKVEEA